MKIAVNTRLLLKNRLEGIGWFTFESLKRIVLNHPEHEFFFIFDRPYDETFIFAPNVTPVVTGPQARHPILFIWWFEFSIPRILRKIGADAFISPDAYLSLRTHIPSLLVIHDLNFEHYPSYIPPFARWHYRYFTPRFARRANRIATVSAYSRNDIINLYHIDENKVDVVYNGANPKYSPVSGDEKIKTREEYTSGKPYFLFIGALNPRKNLDNLFAAFDLFCEQHPASDMMLVVVGEKMYWSREIEAAFKQMRYPDRVIFTGHLEESILARILGAASALLYASRFEGFGIPIIEAFYAGTPVITSNTTSMPEVAGEAALLVDPMNKQEISNAMYRLISEPDLGPELIRKGNARKSLFTWDKTADALWASFMKMITIDNEKP